jgi:release factor glutamine methyltransferase
MHQAFAAKGLDSPRLLAEQLVAHVLGCDRLRLYLELDRPASPLERAALRDLAGRALKHEPVQYLVGEAWFFGLPFKVDRRTLIPRPCTQTIVEHVLQRERALHGPSRSDATRGDGLLIADIGTGSGAIITALLKHLPLARGVATDISADALLVARENAGTHGVAERVEFLHGDLLAPLADYPPTRSEGSLAYILSNPPYIPDDQWPDQVDANVREHEPHTALRGGHDGMRFLGPLIENAPRLVKPGGQILLELAAAKAPICLARASLHPLLTNPRILKDHEGLERVLVAERTP